MRASANCSTRQPARSRRETARRLDVRKISGLTGWFGEAGGFKLRTSRRPEHSALARIDSPAVQRAVKTEMFFAFISDLGCSKFVIVFVWCCCMCDLL